MVLHSRQMIYIVGILYWVLQNGRGRTCYIYNLIILSLTHFKQQLKWLSSKRQSTYAQWTSNFCKIQFHTWKEKDTNWNLGIRKTSKFHRSYIYLMSLKCQHFFCELLERCTLDVSAQINIISIPKVILQIVFSFLCLKGLKTIAK